MVPGCVEPYPLLQQFLADFEAQPAIAAYMKSNHFIARPVNNMSDLGANTHAFTHARSLGEGGAAETENNNRSPHFTDLCCPSFAIVFPSHSGRASSEKTEQEENKQERKK